MDVHSKCTYCNFNKYVDPNVDNERMERALVTELKSELAYWGLDKVKRPIRSIYFGGGTPSLARPRMFESILDTLSSVCTLSKDTEISMEGNPSSTTSIETLRTLRDIGINRYSLGIQSFQGHILTELGRDHSPATALRSLIDARAVWPGRVSMDLIMGHSGQTLEDWIKELRFTMDIVDDHLSLYHLTVEPGTAYEILLGGCENAKSRALDLLEYLDKDATAWCIDAGLLQLSAASLSPTERGMAVADELSVRLLP
ncbi:radical S-adenosyl methionine domain-containing protein 1 [Mortierella sp. AD032]|nr:radical S-adenosyl methionine domain-containing protein 1 [Mortierella sp. AD032]